MNNLEVLNEVRISSKDLCNLINHFRAEEGNTTEKRHDVLLRDIRNEISVLKEVNIPAHNFVEGSYIDNQNQQRPCFSINRDGALQILNKESALVRYKTIQYINKLEKELNDKNKPSYMIENPKERAKRWIEEYEEKEKLALENEEQTKVIQIQSDVIEEMKPKALVGEALEVSKDSCLVGELAKLLKQNGIDIGQNRLFEWMRENGYLIRRKGADYNMPTQKSMNLGLFEIKETNIVHSDGTVKTRKTPKVTGKGKVYFINKFLSPKELMNENKELVSQFKEKYLK